MPLTTHEALLANPMSAIFSRSGMVWYGGCAEALLLIVIETRRRGLPLGKMADLCSPTLATGYVHPKVLVRGPITPASS